MARQDQKIPYKKAGARVKKKVQRTVPNGIAHISAEFNNTIVTITDLAGNVVAWSSGGKSNFSGSRKSSAYAGTITAQNAARDAIAMGMKECEVNVKGPGAGRESAIRGLQSAGLVITMIRDRTPVPHGGTKPPKRRRV